MSGSWLPPPLDPPCYPDQLCSCSLEQLPPDLNPCPLADSQSCVCLLPCRAAGSHQERAPSTSHQNVWRPAAIGLLCCHHGRNVTPPVQGQPSPPLWIPVSLLLSGILLIISPSLPAPSNGPFTGSSPSALKYLKIPRFCDIPLNPHLGYPPLPWPFLRGLLTCQFYHLVSSVNCWTSSSCTRSSFFPLHAPAR